MKIVCALIMLLGPSGLNANILKDVKPFDFKKISAVETYGDFFQFCLPLAATAHSALFMETVPRNSYVISMIEVGLCVHSLKYITGRPRPKKAKKYAEKGLDPRDTDWVGRLSLNSFPSGHTAISFAAATYFSYYASKNSALMAFTVAGLVGLTRVHSNVHYVSDVIAGAALGALIVNINLISAKSIKSSIFKNPIDVVVTPNCLTIIY